MMRQKLAFLSIRKFRKIQSKIFQQNEQESQDKAAEACDYSMLSEKQPRSAQFKPSRGTALLLNLPNLAQWPDQIAFTKPNKCYLLARTWEKSEAQPFSLLQNIKVGRRTFKCRTTDKPRILPTRTVTSKWPLMNLRSLQQYIWTVCSIYPSVWVQSTSWTFRSWVFFNYTPLLNNGNSTYQYNE